MKKRAYGFTIVELLIVIVVIAILAAISIVAYRGIQDRANSSSASAKAAQIARQVQVYYAQNDTYPDSLSQAGVTDTSGLQYKVNNTTNPKTYCLTATTSNKSYYISNTNTSPTEGGCSGHGVGGAEAISNLVPNPSFESNTTGWSTSAISPSIESVGVVSGSNAVRLTPNNTISDSFIRIGNNGVFPNGVVPGSTYTVSATIYLPAAQTGVIDSSRPRSIIVYSWNGATPTVIGQSVRAPNSAGSTRLNTTFTVPSSATALEIRLYNGAQNTSSVVYWDAAMITEGTTLYSYADGNSPNWDWNGTVNASSSSGPAL